MDSAGHFGSREVHRELRWIGVIGSNPVPTAVGIPPTIFKKYIIVDLSMVMDTLQQFPRQDGGLLRSAEVC